MEYIESMLHYQFHLSKIVFFKITNSMYSLNPETQWLELPNDLKALLTLHLIVLEQI